MVLIIVMLVWRPGTRLLRQAGRQVSSPRHHQEVGINAEASSRARDLEGLPSGNRQVVKIMVAESAGTLLWQSSRESCGSAGEAEEDGYEDEYQLEDIDIGAANYIKAVPVGNWRHMWEDTNPDSELPDDYGLGVRDSLQVPSPPTYPQA